MIPTCSCGKPLPDLAIHERDPYCSTECARAAHGCSLPNVRQPGPTTTYTAKTKRQTRAETPAEKRYRQAWGHPRTTAA